jgi:GTPase
MYKKIEKSS